MHIKWTKKSSSASNHMFVRAIWDKLPECIFENLKLPERNEGNFKVFKNHEGNLSPKLPESNMWLLVNYTKAKNNLYWNWYLLTAGNYTSTSGQLQNNTVNGAMLITMNRVINDIINYYKNSIGKFYGQRMKYRSILY